VLTFRGKDLYTMVLTVTYINQPFMHQKAVRQVELAPAGLPWLTPREFQLAFRGESVHPRVAIPVGDKQVSRRIRD